MLEWIDVYAFVNIDFRRRVASADVRSDEGRSRATSGPWRLVGRRWGMRAWFRSGLGVGLFSFVVFALLVVGVWGLAKPNLLADQGPVERVASFQWAPEEPDGAAAAEWGSREGPAGRQSGGSQRVGSRRTRAGTTRPGRGRGASFRFRLRLCQRFGVGGPVGRSCRHNDVPDHPLDRALRHTRVRGYLRGGPVPGGRPRARHRLPLGSGIEHLHSGP